jgi:hypothetical protein
MDFSVDRPAVEVGPTHHPGRRWHGLAGRQHPLSNEPFDHRLTDLELFGGLLERQPVFAFGEMRSPLLGADTGDAVSPPGFPRTGAIAQAIERGGGGGIAADLGKLTNEIKDMGVGRPTRLARQITGDP